MTSNVLMDGDVKPYSLSHSLWISRQQIKLEPPNLAQTLSVAIACNTKGPGQSHEVKNVKITFGL